MLLLIIVICHVALRLLRQCQRGGATSKRGEQEGIDGPVKACFDETSPILGSGLFRRPYPLRSYRGPSPAASAESSEARPGQVGGVSRHEARQPTDDLARTTGTKSPRVPSAFLPAPAVAAGTDGIPVQDVSEIYDRSPTLIPSFAAEGKKHYRDPKVVKAWRSCGEGFVRRQGLEDTPVNITMAYTIEVKNQVARVTARDALEGGDDELMRCLWDAEEWMRHSFPAEGATDGIFRWRAPNYKVWAPR